MKKNLKWMLLAALLVVLLAAATGLYNKLKDSVELDIPALQGYTEADWKAQPTPVHSGYITPTPRPAAPDFTVYDGEGSAVTLSSFRGKPVVVNFWASWCGPCQSEMPSFQKAWEEYGDRVQFVFVNKTDGSRETVDTATAFMEKKGYTFPVYFDTDKNAAITYGVNSIPTTFFFAADGSQVAKISGAISLKTLEKGLSMIMK